MSRRVLVMLFGIGLAGRFGRGPSEHPNDHRCTGPNSG